MVNAAARRRRAHPVPEAEQQPPVSVAPSAPPAAAAVNLTGPDLPWDLVEQFRLEVADRLSGDETYRDLDQSARLAYGQQIIRDVMDDHTKAAIADGRPLHSAQDDAAIAQAVFDALFMLGRLQPLLDTPGVENLELYGGGETGLIVVEDSSGTITELPAVHASSEDLTRMLQFLAANANTALSSSNPRARWRLPGGQRVVATIPPLSPRPQANIRRHTVLDVTMNDQVDAGVVDEGLGRFLTAAVRAGLSIMVVGPQGSGKTRMMRALASTLSPTEAIATLESEYELHLHEMPRHRRVFAWEAQSGAGEIGPDGHPVGQVTLNQIIPDTLGMNRSMIIVGESRDGQSLLAVFEAMAAGAGSMSTLHADNARDALTRMRAMVMSAGPQYSAEFAEQTVAVNVDLIVYLHMPKVTERQALGLERKPRVVSEVLYVDATEGVTDVYRPTSPDDPRARPYVFPDALRHLTRYGFDPTATFLGGQS